MRNISELELFKELDKKSLTKKVSSLKLNEVLLSHTQFSESLNIIERRFNYLLKLKVIEGFMNNELNLVYLGKSNDIPNPFTYWIAGNTAGLPVSYGNMSNYLNFKNGEVDRVDPKTLFNMLQNMFILRETYLNFNSLTMNVKLVKSITISYVKMFSKILDKNFGIKLKPQDEDMINYTIALFFSSFLLERTINSTIESIAYSTVRNKTPHDFLKSRINLNNFDMESLSGFVKSLSENYEILDKLTFRIMISEWATLYGETTILGMESLGYFLAVVTGSDTLGNIEKDYFISSLVDREIPIIMSEFSKIISK